MTEAPESCPYQTDLEKENKDNGQFSKVSSKQHSLSLSIADNYADMLKTKTNKKNWQFASSSLQFKHENKNADGKRE